MKRTVTCIQALDFQEIDDIQFVFTSGMRPGEEIALAEVSVLCIGGEVDPDPQAMVVGDPRIGTVAGDVFTQVSSGRVVLQRFKGQLADSLYDLRCLVTLSTGRQLLAAGHMAVVQV